MAEEVVTGDAVHSKAQRARDQLEAARRRRRPAIPAPALVPGETTRSPVARPEADLGSEDEDPRLAALVAENRDLRAEIDDLRQALRRLADDARHVLDE